MADSINDFSLFLMIFNDRQEFQQYYQRTSVEYKRRYIYSKRGLHNLRTKCKKEFSQQYQRTILRTKEVCLHRKRTPQSEDKILKVVQQCYQIRGLSIENNYVHSCRPEMDDSRISLMLVISFQAGGNYRHFCIFLPADIHTMFFEQWHCGL